MYSSKTFSYEYGNFVQKLCYMLAIVALLLTVLLCLILSDISRMSIYTYNDINKIPYNRTGLVLGTSKYLVKGGLNTYFTNRIDATVELYQAHKIDYIVVSGDNAHPSYNEPRYMRQELIARGIPKDRIYLDYAGFRTLDSVVRIHRIFRQKNVTIISQDFQNERAIYLARHNGINAIGYNAKSTQHNFFTSSLREFFARIKCIIDVYIFDTKPKFLGDSIEIGAKSIDSKEAQMNDNDNDSSNIDNINSSFDDALPPIEENRISNNTQDNNNKSANNNNDSTQKTIENSSGSLDETDILDFIKKQTEEKYNQEKNKEE